MAKRPCHGRCFDAWLMGARGRPVGFEQSADFVPLLGAGKIDGEAPHAEEPRLDLSGLDGESKDIFRPKFESVGYQRFGSSRLTPKVGGLMPREGRWAWRIGITSIARRCPLVPCLRTELSSIKQELRPLLGGTPKGLSATLAA
jgi:hypothetical protein